MHTLPWKLKKGSGGHFADLLDAAGEEVPYSHDGAWFDSEDGDLIVQAVNAHDGLLAVAQAARTFLLSGNYRPAQDNLARALEAFDPDWINGLHAAAPSRIVNGQR